MVNNVNYLISGDDDGNLIVFNLIDFSICYRLKHKREVISISISPDELSFATGGFDKTVQIWNLSKGSNLGKYFHVGPVYKIMYYDDLIISCSKDKMIRMFKVSKNKVISDLSVDDEIYDFDYSCNLLITGLKNSKVNFFY
ncbi:NLE1 [Hepatospora eriocheir]|uniref:NLE1 n=1 Tax=Hepatospora eriocheir TaxID=1081669 RepID=A0A1X0Q730_9MICR|nr:NLE1 [Hepatospora eriocheir]